MHDRIIVQLAKNRRNMLLENELLWVRLWDVWLYCKDILFDHSGVIVTNLKAFSYTSSPHLLGDFFWRLVHPRNSSSGIASADTTITRPTKEEAERILGVIQRYHPGLEIDVAEFQQDSC
jgi:hypothetical protein